MSAAAPGAGLAALFGGLTQARNHAFDRGWLPVRRLAAPVISIGNLSVGGTGKTPAVIALGRALAARGIRFDVLTRGYGRAGGSRLRVLAPVPPAAAATAAGPEAGDEPRLIARALGVPVLVCPDRAAGGRQGERQFGSQLHLLDDGFQRRQLARCFDLVLVAPEDLDGQLLPAGRLREPPRALARAHAILWVSPSTGAGDWQAAQSRLRRWSPAPVYLGSKQPLAPAIPAGRRIFAFCALGRPDSFWQTLETMPARVVGRRSFRDHHRYQPADLDRLRRTAAAAGAEAFATTEKDALNLPVGHGLAPLHVVAIEMRIREQERLLAAMLAAAGLGDAAPEAGLH
ncbi:MAG: tetraacyldisaccharide 4'-kinase [Terriglobales bacterium]